MQVEQYLECRRRDMRPKYHHDTSHYLRRWPANTDMTRRHIVRWLDSIEAESGSVTADRAKAALSGYCSWLVDRGEADDNPARGIRLRAKVRSRDRVLSLEELAGVYTLAGRGDYGDIVRLLILTGCRRGEIGALAPGEIQADRLVLGAGRTKQGRPHMVPILPGWPVRPFAFQGWSKSLERLRRRVGLPEPWHLHDLRRSAATHWADLGLADADLIELALGHKRPGVGGIYNRSARWQERQALAAAWTSQLSQASQCPRS